MITEDYVGFEIAKSLKEKGFDEECLTGYDVNGHIISYSSKTISAPTNQMAMKWLREVHNIFIVIEPHMYDYINEKNASYVFSLWQGDNYCENPLLKDFPYYEEAVEAALKYVLENLI